MPRPRTAVTAGVFLLSLGLLLFELCLTRVLSVLYYYHSAFLAISIAMLGLSAGGLWVQLAPRAPRRHAGALVCAAGVSMALLPPLFPLVYLERTQLEDLFCAPFMASFALTAAASLVPFIGGGAALAIVFDLHRARVGRLYSADLLGAAAGALLLVPVMERLGGPGAMLACGALTAASALLLGKGGRRAPAIATLAMVALTAAQVQRDVFTVRVDVGTIEGPIVAETSFEKWNAFSRVVLLDDMGWDRGLSDRRFSALEGRLPRQKEALIDIEAHAPMVEWDGDPDSVRHLADSVSNLAHHLVDRGADVAIIGPGCGKDVVGALLFEPREVVGIEINPILVDLVLGDYAAFAGDVYRHPRVHVVVGDGRRELARMDRRFDVIIANSVATWAAHSAGAMNLSEQGLFTDRALALFRDRLEDDGVFSVSLLDGAGHSLPVRLISTWRATLGTEGRAALPGCVAVIGNPWPEDRWFTTVLLSRRPFTAAQRERLGRLSDELGFDALYVPGRAGADPAVAGYLESPESFTREFAYDVSPATDDRPFFFYTLRLADVLRGRDLEWRSDNVAFLSLVVSFAVIAVVVALLVALPLVWVTRVRGEPASLHRREMLYFGLVGAGFMLVEISAIQRLTMYLGHPTYSLTVGLAGILAWSSLGSRFAARAAARVRSVLAVLVVVLAATWWGLPASPGAAAGVGVATRIALAFAMLGPAGVLLGVPMPAGLRAVGRRPGLAIPWAWAINAALGVLASVAAVLIAVLFGFSAAFACGCACYALACLVWRDDGGPPA